MRWIEEFIKDNISIKYKNKEIKILLQIYDQDYHQKIMKSYS